MGYRTVGGWLVNFGAVPELTNEPALPDAETFDAIAAQIREEAKDDVRAEVADFPRDDCAMGCSTPPGPRTACGKLP